MAELLSTLFGQQPKRFYAVSFVSNRLRILDTERAREYIIKVTSAEEAVKMMDLDEAGWISWLATQGEPA